MQSHHSAIVRWLDQAPCDSVQLATKCQVLGVIGVRRLGLFSLDPYIGQCLAWAGQWACLSYCSRAGTCALTYCQLIGDIGTSNWWAFGVDILSPGILHLTLGYFDLWLKKSYAINFSSTPSKGLIDPASHRQCSLVDLTVHYTCRHWFLCHKLASDVWQQLVRN